MLTIALLDVLEVHACVRMVVVSIVKRVKFSQALMTDVSSLTGAPIRSESKSAVADLSLRLNFVYTSLSSFHLAIAQLGRRRLRAPFGISMCHLNCYLSLMH